MSENKKMEYRDFSVFDTLPTEALEGILRADAQQLDDDTNIDAVLYITDLLEKRAVNAGDEPINTANLLQKLKKECQCEEWPNLGTFPDGQVPVVPLNKGKKRMKPVLRFAAAIITVVCLLVVSTGVAAAFGVNIWNVVATWTEDAFEFKNSFDEVTDDDPVVVEPQKYGCLQDALDEYGISCIVESEQLLDAYVMNVVDMIDDGNEMTIYADYYSVDDGVHFFSICLREHNGHPSATYEKTGEDVQTFSVGDTVCYEFKNTNNSTIAWLTETYECSVASTMTLEELRPIATSLIVE